MGHVLSPQARGVQFGLQGEQIGVGMIHAGSDGRRGGSTGSGEAAAHELTACGAVMIRRTSNARS